MKCNVEDKLYIQVTSQNKLLLLSSPRLSIYNIYLLIFQEYSLIKKYKERSTKLKECFESISKEIIKSNTNCEMVAITNELKKMQIINQKYHCMDERFFQIISKTAPLICKKIFFSSKNFV